MNSKNKERDEEKSFSGIKENGLKKKSKVEYLSSFSLLIMDLKDFDGKLGIEPLLITIFD